MLLHLHLDPNLVLEPLNNIGRNADELLRKVEAAQFVATHDGEVCPAKWKKGGETLKPSIDLVGKI